MFMTLVIDVDVIYGGDDVVSGLDYDVIMIVCLDMCMIM